MRAVLQRVSQAEVEVAGETVAAILSGLLVFLGVGPNDGEADATWMADKIAGLRIFADDGGKMNRDVTEISGAVLVVSQFTLYGDCRKGRRPGFAAAAPPQLARQLYAAVIDRLRERGLEVAEGIFQAEMRVTLVNDGPVTLLLDSEKLF
ncbi:MAG: D-tyrosyl-tRNA(Tyr) deacylase [Desulfobulbaceae bacterium]|jgi:D-tyrosyl-tRNA(Tyr) deacylase|nr:D-tyrosyl-tRNA(Tyr) deacylase [Desulfobulbaceae bacterium]